MFSRYALCFSLLAAAVLIGFPAATEEIHTSSNSPSQMDEVIVDAAMARMAPGSGTRGSGRRGILG
jgi:hypothetical protein